MRGFIVFVLFLWGISAVSTSYEPLKNNLGIPIAAMICFTLLVVLLLVLNKFWEGRSRYKAGQAAPPSTDRDKDYVKDLNKRLEDAGVESERDLI